MITPFAPHLALDAFAALMFGHAAWLKIRGWAMFEGVVGNYRLLPLALVAPVAIALPIAEGVTAVALPIPAAQQPLAELAAAVLLAVFALAVGVNLARGRGHIDCGCGDSRSRQPLKAGMVIRNLVLAALLALAALSPAGPASAAGALVGIVAGAAVFLLYLCFEAFAALPAPSRSSPPPPDPRLGFAVHQRTRAAS